MTKDQEFKQEFFALLRKYNAEMYIRRQSSTINLASGVSFGFDPIDWNPSCIAVDLDLGAREDGKEFV